MDIDGEAREQSGIGFSTGASAGYSHRLGNDFSAVLGGGVNASIYTDSKYNVYDASQSAELRYLISGGFLGAGRLEPGGGDDDQEGRCGVTQNASPHLNGDTMTRERA